MPSERRRLSTGVGGSFVGDHFTSDAIPLNDPYTLLLNDVNNCGLVPINGFSNFCLYFAGEMDLDTLQGCVGDSTEAIFLGFEELEVEDTLLFFLHTNSIARYHSRYQRSAHL